METFEGTLRESDKKHHKKHWVSQSNLSHFRDIRERHLPMGKQHSATSKNVVQKPYKHWRL